MHGFFPRPSHEGNVRGQQEHLLDVAPGAVPVGGINSHQPGGNVHLVEQTLLTEGVLESIRSLHDAEVVRLEAGQDGIYSVARVRDLLGAGSGHDEQGLSC